MCRQFPSFTQPRPPDVYWLPQIESDIPAGSTWLSAGEIERLDSIRFPKRRADWRLGRWTSKCAVAAYLHDSYDLSHLSNIEVRAGVSGAPEIFQNNRRSALNISLSHRDGFSICALAPVNMLLGCDVETIEPRSEAFVSDYFADEERELLARIPQNERPEIVAALWSAKESALKAMQIGLRADTRFVVVHDLDLDGNRDSAKSVWRPMQVSWQGQTHFYGWWRIAGKFVLTVVGYPWPSRPVELTAPRKPVQPIDFKDQGNQGQCGGNR